MKVKKCVSFSSDFQSKVDKILNYYLYYQGLEFNTSSLLEYVLNDKYIELVRKGYIKD